MDRYAKTQSPGKSQQFPTHRVTKNLVNQPVGKICRPTSSEVPYKNQSPIAAQKTIHVRNVVPTHPPFGGIELEMATVGI